MRKLQTYNNFQCIIFSITSPSPLPCFPRSLVFRTTVYTTAVDIPYRYDRRRTHKTAYVCRLWHNVTRHKDYHHGCYRIRLEAGSLTTTP